MRRLDSHKDNYRNVPIIMPPEEDDASIRIAQRRKRRGDYDGVDDRGPRKRGRKPKKEKEVCIVKIQIRPCCEGAPYAEEILYLENTREIYREVHLLLLLWVGLTWT